MTRRTPYMLLAVPVMLVGLMAGLLVPASAGPGGIRSTTEYQKLKSYVSMLESKRNDPATQQQISKYRQTLNQRRTAANNKVRSLYRTAITNAKEQRQTSRDKVRRMRDDRRAEIASLKRSRNSQLQELADNKQSAVNRVTSEYNGKINRLQSENAKLQRKLNRAKQASVRKQLREEIQANQRTISSLTNAKQDELRLIETRYRNNVETLKEKFSAQIARSKAESLKQIKSAEAALRERFQARRDAAQTRRGDEFAVVRSTYERGQSAINAMPVRGQNDNQNDN